jgi:hypothetical protein
MRFKFIIFGLIPFLTMCNPIVAHVKNSRRVSNENRAKEFKDFDDSKPIGNWRPRMNYKIGDRFKLKQPMYLHYDVTGSVELTETFLFNVPKLDKYKKNPELYEFGGDNIYQVIRLVDKGTIIQFVSSKSSGGDGALYYFVIQGEDDWFRCSSFKSWDESRTERLPNGDTIRAYTYDRELFEKL